MNHQLPTPTLTDYHTFPPHLLKSWARLERISKHNYPRAMQMAAAWGVALAEWHIQKESQA